ncbi:MAG: hypothetical protein QM766_26495 [Burkholderiaceae bacterium]
MKGLEAVDFDTIKDIAQEVWYGSKSLSLAELIGPKRNDALRLIGRLADFQITPALRKRVLHNQIRTASGFTLGTPEASAAPDFDDVFGKLATRLEPLQHVPYNPLRRN